MKDKLEKAANDELIHSYAMCVDGELAYQRDAMLRMFIKGAQWQKDNMWTSIEEGLPEDRIKSPKFGQEIKCLGYYDGDVFPCTRFYEIEGDDEDIGFAWIWDDGDPEAWMLVPEFKKGEKNDSNNTENR